jgi:hypothetical protein
MLKDIPNPIVEDIALAVVQEDGELDEPIWNTYLINLKKEEIEGVLVTSKGYGNYEGKEVKTTILRHFLDIIPPKSYSKIEPIIDNLFGLNNEYWISFFLKGVMYDKKYIFLPESIKEEHFTLIPIINKKGVMIK